MRRIVLSKHPTYRGDFLAHFVWPKDDDEKKRLDYIELTNASYSPISKDVQDEYSMKTEFPDGVFDNWANTWRAQYESDVINHDKLLKIISERTGSGSLEKEISKNIPKFIYAGNVICRLASMIQHHSNDPRVRGGPGIKKAQEVVSDLQTIALTKVESAWLNYRTVAHFGAAAVDIMGNKSSDIIALCVSPTANFISRSQFYENLLTTFVPKGRKSALVSKSEVWRLPLEMENEEVDFSCAPLTEEQLTALGNREYR
ncbi:MAG: hypothetical protein QM488_18995 [Rhizobiaceae bacterium]